MGKYRSHCRKHIRSAKILFLELHHTYHMVNGWSSSVFDLKMCIVDCICTFVQIHIGLPNNLEFSCSIVCNLIQTGSWVRNTLCCFRKQVPNSSSLLNPKSSPSSPKIFFFTHWNYLPSPSKSSPLPQNIFPFSGNSRNSITGSDMPSALGLVYIDPGAIIHLWWSC